MDKADTPAVKPPEKEKEKVIAPKTIDTPAEKPEGESTPPEKSPQEKKITELKGQVEGLQNDLKKQEKITKTAQRSEKVHEIKMKKLTQTLEDIREGKIEPTEIVPEDETSDEKDVRTEVRIGIQNLFIGNPAYQKLLDNDTTLREVIKNNPLALIGDYLDAEDAIEQMTEKLDKMISSSVQPEQEEKKEGEESPEFEAGPTQPKEVTTEPPKPKTSKTLDEKLKESIEKKINIT